MDALKEREAQIMEKVPHWSPGDLKAPVPGIGKAGIRDLESAEPVYHTTQYVAPTFVMIPDEYQMAAQWWRGSKMFMKVNFLLYII
jgi:hypothetical protein